MKHLHVDPESRAILPSVKSKSPFNHQRLRLAQGSLPSSPTTGSSRPPLLRSKSASYLKPTTRWSKKNPSASNDHLSTADAQWFLSLPPKVQRRHFSRDEQLILAGYCDTITLESTENDLPQRPRGRVNRSVSSRRASTSSTSSSESTLYFEAKQEPADSAVDMDDSMMDHLRWMDDQDIDLRLGDYHTPVIEAPAPRKSWSSNRRPSSRRNLTSPILPSSSGSQTASRNSPSISTPTSDEGILPATSPPSPTSTSNKRETFNFLPIHQNRTSIDSSPTRHYQDPEARLNLRVYLASASKFDEAVEFGFPSLSNKETSFPIQGRPSLSSHRYNTAPAAAHTFFDDSSTSVYDAFDCPEEDDDDDDRDAASLPDLEMPRTPSDTVFRNTHRLPTNSSMPSKPLSKPSSKRPSIDYPSELQTSLKPKIRYLAPDGNREMTLRMTLTRPDLRTAEETKLYGEMGDPLSLEELPPPRNGRTLWDEPPKEKGFVRRVWRRVSGKGCHS